MERRARSSGIIMLLALAVNAPMRAWADSDKDDNYYGGGSSGGGEPGTVPTSFEPWVAADCRSCHDDWTSLPLGVSNPDNHHLKVGTTINHTTAPNAVLGQLYDCTTCHVFTWSDAEYRFIMNAERNCFVCHGLATVANQYLGNRHHDTATARSFQCTTCHARMPPPHLVFGGPPTTTPGPSGRRGSYYSDSD